MITVTDSYKYHIGLSSMMFCKIVHPQSFLLAVETTFEIELMTFSLITDKNQPVSVKTVCVG
jgi:hypothetical protein